MTRSAALGMDDILRAIPHRPPFLFLDEIVEIDAERIVARNRVAPESDFFRGHYPHHPVMPGVLLCECCFQAGAVLIARRAGDMMMASGVPVVTRISDAKFRRMVRPGDVLTIEARIDDVLDEAYYLTGRVSVENAAVLRLGFACMLARTEDVAP